MKLDSIKNSKQEYKTVNSNFGRREDIPITWDVSLLAEVADFRQGLQIAKIERFKQAGTGRLKLIKVMDFANKESDEYINIPSKKSVICTKNDIIIARTGTLGLVLTNVEGVFHNNTFAIDYNRDIFDKMFFYYYLKSSKVQQFIKVISTRTSQSDLTHREFSQLVMFIPPKEEQQKIASIILKVDELIQKTDQIIKQTQRLKKGLMQYLFSEGIGQKRFKQAMDEFNRKISIPSSWKIVKLKDVCEILDGKRVPIEESQRNKRHGIYPYYGASGIIDYIDSYIFDEKLLCLAEDGENLRSRVLPVAFVIEGKTWVNNHAHVLRPKNEFIDLSYFQYFLNHIKYDKYLSYTAQPKLNQDNMKRIDVILPPVEEQRRIASIIATVDDKRHIMLEYKMKINSLKKGLMQKLFMGRVRVKV